MPEATIPIDSFPCEPFPLWSIDCNQAILKDHALERWCDSISHWQLRADPTSGNMVKWITGWCPKHYARLQSARPADPLDEKTFETFDPAIMRKPYNTALDYAKGFGPGSSNAIMVGDTGRGKTHLALAIRNSLKRRHFRVEFIRAEEMPDIFVAAQPSSPYPEEHFKALNRLADWRRADLLIIDDLGGFTDRPESEFFLQRIKELIDTTNGKFLITTNCDEPTMMERFGEKILSRMKMGTKIMPFDGADYRPRKSSRR